MVDEASVTKGGEVGIYIGLSRSLGGSGLLINVKAHSALEDFMRRACGGVTQSVDAHARYWARCDVNGKETKETAEQPLQVYNFLVEPVTENGVKIDILPVGTPLVVEGPPKTNISFLRLVGISDPEGVRFVVRGVYSKTDLLKIRDRISIGVKRFYDDYVKPIELNSYIMMQGS